MTAHPDPDIMAYLRRRQLNAAVVAGNLAESEPLHDLAKDCARQLQVVIDDLTAGQHLGAAEVEADFAAPAALQSFNREA